MAGRIARENRGKVKTKTIHMHLFNPITEAVDDHSANNRMIRVHRISRTAIIRITGPILLQNVISDVVYPTKTDSWATLITFCSVIKDNVQDYFDSRPVQSLYHVSELLNGTQRGLSGAIFLVRREEGYRGITPIVHTVRWAVL